MGKDCQFQNFNFYFRPTGCKKRAREKPTIQGINRPWPRKNKNWNWSFIFRGRSFDSLIMVMLDSALALLSLFRHQLVSLICVSNYCSPFFFVVLFPGGETLPLGKTMIWCFEPQTMESSKTADRLSKGSDRLVKGYISYDIGLLLQLWISCTLSPHINAWAK